MPISCHMRDLGFSDFKAPASKGPAPKPTHIEHFFHWQRIGEGEGAAAGAGARQTVLSGRGGASLGSSGCGAVPSHCRGGATSCASEGTGRMVRGGGPACRMMRAAAFYAAARLRRWRD